MSNTIDSSIECGFWNIEYLMYISNGSRELVSPIWYIFLKLNIEYEYWILNILKTDKKNMSKSTGVCSLVGCMSVEVYKSHILYIPKYSIFDIHIQYSIWGSVL